MNKVIFTAFSSHYLKVKDLYALITTTISIAIKLKENMGIVAQAILEALILINTSMGNQLGKNKKSIYTEKIKAANNNRKGWYSDIKRRVWDTSISQDETNKAAGKILKLFFDPYWNLSDKAMNTQTINFNKIIAAYKENTELQQNAAIIGIDSMITNLETSNSSFDLLYKARNSEQANQLTPSASSYKQEAAKCFDDFCIAIEQAYNYVGGESLTILYNEMESLRKKYVLLITDNSDEEDEVENTTTETTQAAQ